VAGPFELELEVRNQASKGAEPPHPFAMRRESTPGHMVAPSGRRVADHANERGMVPGDISNLKVGMRAVRFRRGLPSGFPCAPVTLRRA
jgi:hypothetical protein